MTEIVVTPSARSARDRAEPKPLLEVSGGTGRLSPGTLHELWVFREVLTAFVARQLKVRYKQAAVGVGWAVLQPVLAALLFTVFLGRLAHVSSEGVPYLAFAMAGTVAWGFFSNAVSSAMESIITDQSLLRKVYFPREIFPLSAIVATLVDLSAAFLTYVIALLAYGTYPTWTWLALPVPFIVLVAAATALGLLLSALNVFYRDVRYVLPFALQLGLFATPVIYSLSVVPPAWRTVYATLNPAAAAIDGIRRTTLHGEWPALGTTAGALALSTILLVAAYALFKRLERSFSDRV